MNKTLCCTAGEEPSHREPARLSLHTGYYERALSLRGGGKKNPLYLLDVAFLCDLCHLSARRARKKKNNEWLAEDAAGSYRGGLGAAGFWEQHAEPRILNMSVKALPSAGLVMKTDRPTRKTRKETPRHTVGMM